MTELYREKFEWFDPSQIEPFNLDLREDLPRICARLVGVLRVLRVLRVIRARREDLPHERHEEPLTVRLWGGCRFESSSCMLINREAIEGT